jgi:hypothetical protein
MRELIVRRHHLAEALDYAEIFRGELAHNMNETAIALVFDDPSRALQERNNAPWEPHQRYKDLHEEYQKMVDTTPQNNTKRYRNDQYNDRMYGNKSNRTKYSSYANATKNQSYYPNTDTVIQLDIDSTSCATTTNMTQSIDFNKQMDDIKREMKSDFKDQIDELRLENIQIKQSLENFKVQSEINQAKQDTSLERIEKFMIEQKTNYDSQFATMNQMFMMFMSTQMGTNNTMDSTVDPKNNILTKRKLTTIQNQQTKGNELPTNKEDATYQLNSMEEDSTAVDPIGGRLTGKNLQNDE